jgi:hypothetical protein
MEFLNNPWVIGIGGGILSGLIVTFISRTLLSRRDRREYVEKIRGANREVIYAIRPGISEGKIPTVTVIDALAEATARKFAVDRANLFQAPEVAQELTKEVMDSSFISANAKEEYFSQLGVLLAPRSEDKFEGRGIAKAGQASAVEEYRSRMVRMMSMMLGLVSATMTVAFAFWSIDPLSKPSIDALDGALVWKDSLLAVLVPVVAATFAAAMGLAMAWTWRDLRGRTETRESGKHEGGLEVLRRHRQERRAAGEGTRPMDGILPGGSDLKRK